LMALTGLFFESLFESKSVILGGMKVIQENVLSKPGELQRYQQGTYVVGCMAFVGSYVYMLSRLLDRTANNDLYPLSLHYYAARILIACLVAAVFRHCASAMGADSTELLILVGFAMGIAPDLFVVSMVRRAFQVVKVFGSKADPDQATRPTALPLLMLDDLTKEKVDRLNELGIDSAQVLACQNPFIIWPKLPYDLGLIVDWIAAAQLYTLLKESALKAARERRIFDIFDLEIRLRDANARPKICEALGLSPEEADALLAQLWTDQSFTRLLEVRDALRVPASLPIGQARHEGSGADAGNLMQGLVQTPERRDVESAGTR